MRNKRRPLWPLILGKWFCFPICLYLNIWHVFYAGDVNSPPLLLLSRLLWCCCGAALVWCCCCRVCVRTKLFRTQARYAVVVDVCAVACCGRHMTCAAADIIRGTDWAVVTCDTCTRQYPKVNIISVLRVEELLFLGSRITGFADFWPRLFLNPEVTMISGPIIVLIFGVGDPC